MLIIKMLWGQFGSLEYTDVKYLIYPWGYLAGVHGGV
jgi:hypothetical protein